MENYMIDTVFNIFKNIGYKIVETDEELLETKIDEIYYVLCFNDNIDNDILDDIVEWSNSKHEQELEKFIGISEREYIERYIHKNKKHETITNEDFSKAFEKISNDIKPLIAEYSLNKHGIKEEDLYSFDLYEKDIEDFVGLAEIENVEGVYDAYGTALYNVNDKQFVIFSTYDCGSGRRGKVLSLCCYDPQTFKFEVSDIIHNKEKGEFYISDIQTAFMPEDLRKHHIRNFAGKRSFYWDHEEKILKLRCWDDLRLYLDGKDSSKAYSKNVSGNRCEIKLK